MVNVTIPKLTACIIGSQHPLCRSVQIQLEKHHLSVNELALGQSLKNFTHAVQSDYVLIIDPTSSDIKRIKSLVESGGGASWYKFMIIATTASGDAMANTLLSFLIKQPELRSLQKYIIRIPFLYGVGLAGRQHIGLAPALAGIKKNKINNIGSGSEVVRPVTLNEAAVEVVNLLFQPPLSRSSFIITGSRTVTAAEWSHLVVNLVYSIYKRRVRTASKIEEIYKIADTSKTKRIYAKPQQSLEENLKEWLVWLAKPETKRFRPVIKKTNSQSFLNRSLYMMGALLVLLGVISGVGQMETRRDGVSKVVQDAEFSLDKAALEVAESVVELLSGTHSIHKKIVVRSSLDLAQLRAQAASFEYSKDVVGGKRNLTEDMSRIAVFNSINALVNHALNTEGGVVGIVLHSPHRLHGVSGTPQAVLLLEIQSNGGAYVSFKEVDKLAEGLDGWVSPPPELSKLVEGDSWQMQYGNLYSDLGRSGAALTWFIEKSTGNRPYALIGLPSNEAVNLIRALGINSINEDVVVRELIEKWPAIQPSLQNISLAQKTESMLRLIELIANNKGYIHLAANIKRDGGLDELLACQRSQSAVCPKDVFMINMVDQSPELVKDPLITKESHKVELQGDVVKHNHQLRMGNVSENSYYVGLVRLYLPIEGKLYSLKKDGVELTSSNSYENDGEHHVVVRIPPMKQSVIDISYGIKASELEGIWHEWLYLNQVGVGKKKVIVNDQSGFEELVEFTHVMRRHIEL